MTKSFLFHAKIVNGSRDIAVFRFLTVQILVNLCETMISINISYMVRHINFNITNRYCFLSHTTVQDYSLYLHD